MLLKDPASREIIEIFCRELGVNLGQVMEDPCDGGSIVDDDFIIMVLGTLWTRFAEIQKPSDSDIMTKIMETTRVPAGDG